MKVLTINCVYQQFSTGNIIQDIEKHLADKPIQFIHCYENGNKSTNSREYRLSGWILYRLEYVLAHMAGYQYGTPSIATLRLLSIIRKEKPDIVHVHCPNAFSINLYHLIQYLKKRNIKTVITNHAEFFFTGNCAHANDCTQYMNGCYDCPSPELATHAYFLRRTKSAWLKMKEAFENAQSITMVAVSPWAADRIRKATITKGLPVTTIPNGIDTSIFRRYEKCQDDIPILLHVTSQFSTDESDPKSGKDIVKIAHWLQDKGIQVKIQVAGTIGRIQGDLPENLYLLGIVTDRQKLARLYSHANLLVMTSKRETFGLTCAESMCCGTPVVGYKNGGTESIALSEYSEFVEYGDIEKLQEAVLCWIDKKETITEELSKRAVDEYSSETMAARYYDLYNNPSLSDNATSL